MDHFIKWIDYFIKWSANQRDLTKRKNGLLFVINELTISVNPYSPFQ